MEDFKQHRRFFTDTQYAKKIEKEAHSAMKYPLAEFGVADDVNTMDANDRESYHPLVDIADVIADGTISILENRSIARMDVDGSLMSEIYDAVAEGVRYALQQQTVKNIPLCSAYESIPVVEMKPFEYQDKKWPHYDNEIRTSGEQYTPSEIREQLFNRLIDKAIQHGGEPGNWTPMERCLRTAYSVIDVIDGGEGNRPDGRGLPLMQLMMSPHPEYEEGRARQGLPMYDNSVPVDHALLSPTEYQTGMARAFEEHYDRRFADVIQQRSFKAAKDLFGGE